MTLPGAWRDPDDPDRLPTQAELDAEDLAELAQNSRDRELTSRYPRRAEDPGTAPRTLTRDAVVLWYVSAVTALVCIGYGLSTLGGVTSRLTERLEPEMAEVQRVDAEATAASIAGFWPPALLIGWLVAMALTYPVLIHIARSHSRGLRSLYGAMSLVIALFVPLIADLLFAYPAVPAVFPIAAWVSAAALLLSLFMTFVGGVGRWLPETTRIKPSRVWRE